MHRKIEKCINKWVMTTSTHIVSNVKVKKVLALCITFYKLLIIPEYTFALQASGLIWMNHLALWMAVIADVLVTIHMIIHHTFHVFWTDNCMTKPCVQAPDNTYRAITICTTCMDTSRRSPPTMLWNQSETRKGLLFWHGLLLLALVNMRLIGVETTMPTGRICSTQSPTCLILTFLVLALTVIS